MLKRVRQIILVFGDLAALYFSLVLTLVFGFWGKFNLGVFKEHLFPFSILYFLWLVIFYIFDLYNLNVSRTRFLFYPRFIQALLMDVVLGIALFYLWPAFGITPKTNLILNIVFFGALDLIWRRTFYRLFSKRLITYLGILGESRETRDLLREIKTRPYLGYKVRKIYKTSQVDRDFYHKIKRHRIDILIINENSKTEFKTVEALYQCLEARINFWDLPSAYEMICAKIPLSFINKEWFLENLKEREKVFYDKLKRVFDLIFSACLLIATLPLWALIALAVKSEDRGPVFYKQKRVGKDKKVFWLWKFRSMKTDAEKEGVPVWAEKNDWRRTKTGRFLRRTHLDELPQLINVLKGELSLVGPRPERPQFVSQLEKQIPHYHLRHLIKPGVTGWDQIKFKYARTMLDSLDKFEYDLYYLKNRNFLLDLGILLKTFQSLFRKTD